MFYRIKKVNPLDNFVLLIEFENGQQKTYDVKKLFEKHEEFKNLKVINGLFQNVKVDIGGYGISFNDELDLSCNEIYFN